MLYNYTLFYTLLDVSIKNYATVMSVDVSIYFEKLVFKIVRKVRQ